MVFILFWSTLETLAEEGDPLAASFSTADTQHDQLDMALDVDNMESRYGGGVTTLPDHVIGSLLDEARNEGIFIVATNNNNTNRSNDGEGSFFQ